MFSKRYYEIIANTLREVRPITYPIIRDEYNEGAIVRWNMVVENFVYNLHHDNPRFDPNRFLEACGYTYNED